MAERQDLFPLLVKSVCPSIFGNELVKTGLLLSLLGGTDYRLKSKSDFSDFINQATNQQKKGQQEDEDDEASRTMPPIRPDIHMLMVGEPGMGKS